MSNKKIKKLAEYCIKNSYGTRIGVEDFEKFAELLLKEVFKVCDDVCESQHNPEWLLCEMFGIDHNWRIKKK